MSNQVTLTNISKISKELRKNFFLKGNLVMINGPMGAGKTTLLKEILKEYPVSSPSFLHAINYGEEFLHIDAYTMTKENFISLSIEDSLFDKCVVIEWGNLFEDIIKNFLTNKIIITIYLKNDKRYLDVKVMDGRGV